MDDAQRVEILNSRQQLVGDVLPLDRFELTGLENTSYVEFDVLENQVDVAAVLGFDDVQQLHDPGVRYLAQVQDLSVGPLRVSSILESVADLFNGADRPRPFVDDLVDYAVGAAAQPLYNLEFLVDLVLEFLIHVQTEPR